MFSTSVDLIVTLLDITSFSLIQNASDARNGEALVIFQFDLLHVDGEDPSALPLVERKAS
jgi:ATP-dependent DNA ligase